MIGIDTNVLVRFPAGHAANRTFEIMGPETGLMIA